MKALRWIVLAVFVCILSLGLAVACGGDDDDDDNDDDSGGTITVSGNVFLFNQGQRIEGATITVLEFSDLEATSGEEGYFEFEDMPSGSEATFLFEHPDYPTTQTKTFTLGDEDLEQVTFQVPDWDSYNILAALLGITPDPDMCQMVTTVTRVGKSLYDEGAHGEEGAVASVDPELPAEHGPIYFDSSVLPDTNLTETSDDGGVIWTNVPPGVYTLSAEKEGVEFVSPKMTCRAGVLVNASPPYGLQALE